MVCVITHADSLLARSNAAPVDTPAQLAKKTALRAKFINKLTPIDFVEDPAPTATPSMTRTSQTPPATSKASKAPRPN